MGMPKVATTLSFALTMLLSFLTHAAAMYTTYQAKIIKPDGTPLESSSVNFRFTILDPSGSCILYTENFNAINMSDSGGLVYFSLGSGIKTFPTSGTTGFSDVFDNQVTSLSCETGGPVSYTPAANDLRKIVMQFYDGSGWQTLPAMTINHVPYAMYAQSSARLNGKTDLDFVQVTSIPTCSSSQALQFNGASFGCVSVGSGGGGGGTLSVSGAAPIVVSGPVSAPVISITVASMSSDGYLTSADYAEFKAKLSASATQISGALGFTPVSSSAVAAQVLAANLTGDVSGSVSSNTVVSVGGKTASQIVTSVDATLAATSSNTANTLVKRDLSGNLAANDIFSNAAKTNYVDIYKPSANYSIRLQAPTSLSANYSLTFPDNAGVGGQFLSTDGSGHLSWVSQTSQWSTSGTSINYLNGDVGIGTTTPRARLDVSGSVTIGDLAANNAALTIYTQDSGSVSHGFLLIDRGAGYGSWQNPSGLDGVDTDNSGTVVGWGDLYLNYYSSRNIDFNRGGGYSVFRNRVGVGMATTPMAHLHITAGTSSFAALKFVSGTLLATPQAGAMEYNGFNFYITDSTNIRRAIATGSSSGTIDNAVNINSNANMTLTPVGSVIVSSTTASTNASTGALVVNGGLGVAGHINTASNLNVSGSTIIDGSLKLLSMTSGSVLFAGSSGMIMQDNSHFYWDGANKRLGLGTTTPVAKLDVSGGVRLGAESTTCVPVLEGTLRYNASNVEYCNGASWQAFGVAGAGIVNFNGSTSGTQSLVTGAGGTGPAFITANGIHTLHIPLASASAVTAGLISNAEYVSFSNKIASSAASLIEVLGYVPADTAAMSTSFTSVTASLNSVSNTVASLTATVSGIKSSQWSDLSTASSTAAVATTFSPLGQLGLQSTIPTSGGVDDGYFTYTLPFAVSFNGANYSTIYVGTNSYVTFGGGSVNYSSLSAANPAYNKIMIDSADRSSNSVWYYSDATSFSIRFEGGCTTAPSTALVWELQGSIASPSQLKLQIISVCGGGFSTIASPSATLQSISAVASTAYLIDYGTATNGVYLASGNVGIGTNTPAQKFVVSDNGSEGFEVYFNQPDPVVGVQSIDRLTGNYVPMQINASKFSFISGNVGIGTSAPASVLDVSGTLRVSSICDRNGTNCQSITSGWNNGSVSASSSSNGYLTSQDWTNFNSKLSVLDLGSVSATGTIAEARLLTQANVVSGTQYTKVTVDGKGRVTSGSFLTSADIVTALSYTPANSATIVSSQWATSGTNITYNSGNVGIGTTTPATRLDVVGDIQYTGTITDVSDRRLKTNIASINSALSTIRKIKTYSYVMKDDPQARTEYGVMAQDMLGIIPNLVKNIDTRGEYYGVNYMGLIPWSIRALQEVDSETQQLRRENTEIKRELASLKEKHEALEQKLEKILQALEQQKHHGEKK